MITASRTWLAVHDDPYVPHPDAPTWNLHVVEAIREHGPPRARPIVSVRVQECLGSDLSGSGLVLRRNV